MSVHRVVRIRVAAYPVVPWRRDEEATVNVLAIVRTVPDAESRVELVDGAVTATGAYVLDGMDEYGVEQALRWREAGHVTGEVIVAAVGPARTEDALRAALAMGADRARWSKTDQDLDAISVARVLERVVREEEVDVVFVGGKQADWDSAALGPALAELLGWPLIDWTVSIELDGTTIDAVHDVDRGSERVTTRRPAVVTTQQGLAEPRYPTLPNVMKARRKDIRVDELERIETDVRVVSRRLDVRERGRNILEGDLPTQAQAVATILREASS